VWRLVVLDRWTNAPWLTFTEADGVVRLDSFSISPEGDSGDGAFTAVPSQVTIVPRDVIALEVDKLGDGTWERVYLGVVVACGNPRSDTPQPYRTVGTRQRFYERTVIREWVGAQAGSDVATMVTAVLTTIEQLPNNTTFDPADAPTTGFQLGTRFPNLESLGEFLDAMAAAVGGFLVPVGETYTYDGHTYNAGDYVPPVEWGVRPDGSIYFRRPNSTAGVTFNEQDARTTIRWNPINAEQDVTDVRILFFDAYALEHWKSASKRIGDIWLPGTNDPNVPLLPKPIIRNPAGYVSDPAIRSDLVHRLDHPLDYMVRDQAAQSVSGVTGTWTNINNAIDLDPTTFTYSSATPSQLRSGTSFGPTTLLDLFRVRYSTPSGTTNPITAWVVGLSLAPPPGATFVDAFIMTYELPPTDGAIAEAWFVVAPPAGWTGELLADWELRLDCLNASGGDRDKIYYADWWTAGFPTPTPQLLALAQSLVVVPTLSVAAGAYNGFGALTRNVQIIPETGATINARAERIELSFTVEGGVTTTYYLGQPFESDLITDAILMDRLARRAVAAGGRTR